MKRRQFLTGVSACAASSVGFAEGRAPVLTVILDPEKPGSSRGVLSGSKTPFRVGFGKRGVLPAGEAFRGGYSLLGEFSVNAILSAERFEMTDRLISQSGKSREWLAEHLFRNMSSIDFDGDGKGGEYGSAFLGLEPLDSRAGQPFHFGEYNGVFRWYSYAIHGTQDESRIGKCVTGGCVNVSANTIAVLLETVRLGDRVVIELASD